MFESLSAVQLSVAVLAPLACISLLFLAWAIVRRRHHEDTSPEWLEARQYAEVKGLAHDQWLVLAAMLKRFATASPYETITYRHEFDRCVREQINAITGMVQRDKMGEVCREIRVALGLNTVPDGAKWTSTFDLEEKLLVKARPVDQENAPEEEFYIKTVNDAYFYLAARNPEVVADAVEGRRYLMHVCRPADARYEFTAKLAAIRPNPLRLLFAHEFEMKRLQTRVHERSAYTRPTPVDLFVVPESNAHDPMPWLYENDPEIRGTGTFMNLSAGGFAAMLLGPPPPTRAYARVTITLGDKVMPPFTVFARIVGTVALAENRTLLRASFVDATPTQQEAIDTYVAQAKQQEGEAQPKP